MHPLHPITGTVFDYLKSVFALFSIAYVVFLAVWRAKAFKREAKLSELRTEVERKAYEKPEDSKVAWDLARVTLEQYFNRNLLQVNQIFWVAVAVMGVGFGFIIYGAVLALHQSPSGDLSGKLTVLSGIITEFIAATFMVIYRSTLQQANSYMAILEKINAVGMAVQIVETVPKSDPLYAHTRATMAKMLLEQFKPIGRIPNSTKRKTGL